MNQIGDFTEFEPRTRDDVLGHFNQCPFAMTQGHDDRVYDRRIHELENMGRVPDFAVDEFDIC